jgi:hypothetical protein
MTSARASRQSFLGERAQDLFAAARIGVIGLGGGGSHVVQQLAHVGLQRFVTCDPDVVEESNLNRLVGATIEDAPDRRPKVEVASRMIRGLAAQAEVHALQGRWEDHADVVRHVDIIFGCLDSFAARRDLESFARRYLIPLVDIGLDVRRAGDGPPQMSGQVILSMPGAPCMKCLGFLNEVTLAQEAAGYGDAGIRPQVVWANGILASAAVGIAVDLLTGWSTALQAPIYLEYDGNQSILRPSVRLDYVESVCPHFPLEDTGDPQFRSL